jgi:hypothetical protein
MTECANCGAPDAIATDSEGRPICCAHCLFNPLGCRCRFGEPGVAETVPVFVDEECAGEIIDVELDLDVESFDQNWADSLQRLILAVFGAM